MTTFYDSIKGNSVRNNAPLEFLTGLTPLIRDSFKERKERWVALGVAMSRPDQK
jgi:hypothetical protein